MSASLEQSDLTPEHRMLFFRGQPVLLDHDLAALYEVTTKALNQAVRRNTSRFPDDFMFVLAPEEVKALARLRPPTDGTTQSGRGHHRKYPPLAFTEYGVAMLSSVLRSDRAVQVNIAIMRAFGRLRGLVAAHTDLARRLDELEAKTVEHDTQFRAVFDEIRRLVLPSSVPGQPDPPRRQIGFITSDPNASEHLL